MTDPILRGDPGYPYGTCEADIGGRRSRRRYSLEPTDENLWFDVIDSVTGEPRATVRGRYEAARKCRELNGEVR